MSNIDDDAQEFDDLNLSGDGFDEMPTDGMPTDGMPDPTAQSPLDDKTEPASGKGKDVVADSKASKKDKKALKAKKAKLAKKAKKDKRPKKDKTAQSSDPKFAGLLSNVSQASPYTVMLAISVLAIGIALLCLLLEWGSYGFSRKPPKNLTLNRSIEAVHLLVAIDARYDCVARDPACQDNYRRFDPWCSG